MIALLWTFPLLMAASIVIGWAAEVTAVHLSAGIALAILAWLQTTPEFAVEATIAWSQDVHLALANLTGSLRLLIGFGWPMIFFIYWASQKRRKVGAPLEIRLPDSFSVEAAGLAVPVLYFTLILLKGTWTAYDGAALCSLYGFYFFMLNRQRKYGGVQADGTEDESLEEQPAVVRKVLGLSGGAQALALLLMFVGGGLALWVTVHPFVEALKSAAIALGVSEFVFIQWVAPVASEFPEKVTAFNWARKPGKVPFAIVNMLSSVTSQWTLLAGLVPILFSISAGRLYTIEFDDFQKRELLLTIGQSALAVVLLLDLKILASEMLGFFGLWFVQFVMPSTREYLPAVYLFWAVIELGRLLLMRECLVVPYTLRKLFKRSGGEPSAFS